MPNFELKSQGTLGAGFPGFTALLDVFAVPMRTLPPMVKAFFAAAAVFYQAQKFMLMLVLAPVLMLAAAAGGVMSAVTGVFQTIKDQIDAVVDGVSGQVDLFGYVGAVGGMGEAASTFFAEGIPSTTIQPGDDVNGVFYIMSSQAAFEGVGQFFLTTPDEPEGLPPKPLPVNRITKITLSQPSHVFGITWSMEQSYEENFLVALRRTDNPDTNLATFNVGARGPVITQMVSDFAYEDGVSYFAWLEWEGTSVTSDPVVYSAPAITPAPVLAAAAIDDSTAIVASPEDAGITHDGTLGLDAALPFLGFVSVWIQNMITPLEDIESKLTKSVGALSARAEGASKMIDYYTDEIAEMEKLGDDLSEWVEKLDKLQVGLSAAFSVGTVYTFAYSGKVNEIAPALEAAFATAGLPGQADPTKVVGARFILTGDPKAWALLSNLTGVA